MLHDMCTWEGDRVVPRSHGLVCCAGVFLFLCFPCIFQRFSSPRSVQWMDNSFGIPGSISNRAILFSCVGVLDVFVLSSLNDLVCSVLVSSLGCVCLFCACV